MLADSTWRLLLGAAGGEDTDRLLNTADTPVVNMSYHMFPDKGK